MLVETFRLSLRGVHRLPPRAPQAGEAPTPSPFVGQPRIPNQDYVLTLDTPDFAQFSGSLFLLWGHDENFFEWASGDILWVTVGLDWRPTDKLRLQCRLTI